ncbi:MAG: LacI family DNA-binding transcriptional regulator [Actinomycetota bacterium]|nr:LacI family DNA-binding transcriptional regulator [Actinomycetota bacterium]
MGRTGDQKLNMRQVAALAGVSHQTVSRVINGHPNIAPQTRARVLEVIEQVNYRPNSAARALATNKSNRIGVLVDSAVQYGPNSTLRAIEDAARKVGYAVSSVAIDEDRALGPSVAVEHLVDQGVDALCAIAPRSSSVDLLRELSGGLPTLVVKATPDPSFLTVSVDQQLGAALAVQHLVDLGHREILHLAGPLDWLDAKGRAEGWHAEMSRAGLGERPIVEGDWSSDFGYQWACFSDLPPEVTAVFAGNDQMALGVVHGLSERGVRVPDDVSVVGFDDLPDAAHFLPPLTTVRQDFHALGVLGVETLLAVLEGRDTPRRSLIAPELVVRRSTAPPRSGGAR